MVQAGIGGRTIFEARNRLSYREVAIWKSYLLKYGSLNMGRRLEQSIGNLFANYLTFKGGTNVDPLKFMPFELAAKRKLDDDSRTEESILKSFLAVIEKEG